MTCLRRFPTHWIRRTPLFVLLAWLSAAPLFGEIILPSERVRWGENIHVVVRPRPGSGLRPGDRAWLIVYFWSQGLRTSHVELLNPQSEQFSCDLTLPDNWEYAQAAVVTTEAFIPGQRSLPALDRQGRVPPGAAVLEAMNGPRGPDWEAVATAELARNPSLWWLYPEVWGLHFMASGGRVPVELIRKHLTFLEEGEESAQLLRALTQGYWNLGETDKAFEHLGQLCEQYPNSPDTIRALYSSSYEMFKKGLLPVLKDKWMELVARAVNSAPENPALRTPLYGVGLCSAKGIALPSVERLFAAWTQDADESPYPYMLLGQALARDGTRLDRAEELVSRGLELFFTARPFDVTVGGFVGSAFRLRSDLRARRGDLAGALADIRAAQGLAVSGDPTDIEKEAEIWLLAGRPAKAEEIALDAYRQGSLEAERFVKNLYLKRGGDEEGADAYFWAQLTDGAARSGAVPDDLQQAPDFDAVTLDGVPVDNAAVRGRIVVLNFWFTTCGPCVGEMGDLNELVRDYGDRVRFLAFTSEPPEMVKPFLESHTFDYEVVPTAHAIEKSFAIGSHPTHFLIGRQGEILWKAEGANPENLRRLRAMIERLLSGR